MRILFIYLRAFSSTGGIEKFNRALMKALSDLSIINNFYLRVKSLYDSDPDIRYIESNYFQGYESSKIKFLFSMISQLRNYDVILVGHINLAILGLFTKWMYPSKKIILITHGIEVWNKIRGVKFNLLKKANLILAVSQYTKEKICEVQGISDKNIIVFPNAIDPYFLIPKKFSKANSTKNKYRLKEKGIVILTVARMSNKEKYKGYDKILNIIPEIKELEYGNIKYIIVGKYDVEEKVRINKIIAKNNLQGDVILTGFVSEEQLVDIYLASDVFVMPSLGEGFGIVFIEALVCGLPILVSNEGGSKEIIEKIPFGIAVDSSNKQAIKEGLIKLLNLKLNKSQLQDMAIKHYSYNNFRMNLNRIINL